MKHSKKNTIHRLALVLISSAALRLPGQPTNPPSSASSVYARTVEEYSASGFDYFKKGNYAHAVSDYTKAIEIKPDNAGIYFMRGCSYYNLANLTNYTQAIPDFSKAIEINPNYADAYYMRGWSYYFRGDFAKARADANKVIELNSNDKQAAGLAKDNPALVYHLRGCSYYNLADYAQAIPDFTKAIEINPNLADAYYMRGWSYYFRGDFAKAKADANKVIEINSNDKQAAGFAKDHPAVVYYLRGCSYYNLGKYTKAIPDFNKAIEINPDLADAYWMRSWSYNNQGNSAEAVRDSQKCEELKFLEYQKKAESWRQQPVKPSLPEEVRRFRVMAEDAFKNKEFEKAADYYEKGLTLEPLWPEGQYNAAVLYAELQKYPQAVIHMKRFLALCPDAKDAKAARDQMYIWESKIK